MEITFWGVTASPFQLKMQALADGAGLSWQRWPDQAGPVNAIKTAVRLRRARRAQTVERFPERVPALDEYPEVPYYSLDKRQFFYDSSGLAYHLDQLTGGSQGLLPKEPGLRFLRRL